MLFAGYQSQTEAATEVRNKRVLRAYNQQLPECSSQSRLLHQYDRTQVKAQRKEKEKDIESQRVQRV